MLLLLCAGRAGKAITFFTQDDGPSLKSIANVMKSSGCDVPDWMLKLKTKRKGALLNVSLCTLYSLCALRLLLSLHGTACKGSMPTPAHSSVSSGAGLGGAGIVVTDVLPRTRRRDLTDPTMHDVAAYSATRLCAHQTRLLLARRVVPLCVACGKRRPDPHRWLQKHDIPRYPA